MRRLGDEEMRSGEPSPVATGESDVAKRSPLRETSVRRERIKR